MSGRPVVFLDRDGTLVELVSYLNDPAQVVLSPGAADGLSRLRRAGFPVVVVSNQSGVARGMFSVEAVEAVNRRIAEQLGPDAEPDIFLYCPHHPEGSVEEFTRVCACRKPGTGMIDEAFRRLGSGRGYLVGDSPVDIECAAAAGLTPILVATGYGGHVEGADPVPETVQRSADIGDAVRWILEREGVEE